MANTLELISCADCGRVYGVRWPTGYESYFQQESHHEDDCPTFGTDQVFSRFTGKYPAATQNPNQGDKGQ